MRRRPLFPPPETATGRRQSNKGQQRTSLLTLLGRVHYRRRWWHGDEGSHAPLDRYLADGGDAAWSPGVRELACRLNNDAAGTDRAADNLRAAAGLALSGETLRQIVLREGRRVQRAQARHRIPPAFSGGDCAIAPGTPETRLYVGVDGVMVPVITDREQQQRRARVRRKRQRSGKRRRPLPPARRGADHPWKEFVVVAFYDETGARQHHTLSFTRRRLAGRLVRDEARRLKFARADERIGIVDGADWIRTQLEEQAFGLQALGLDFWHLAGNVHRCRKAVFGPAEEPESPGHVWAGELLHCLKHEGFTAAWDKLLEWRRGLRRRTARQAADRLLNYVSGRRDMINYPEFRARGWQIGSGPTEARCRTTTLRLKRPGARWHPGNAAAVASLTTLRDSGQWQTWWAHRPAAKT
jgi:hypothetical protein